MTKRWIAPAIGLALVISLGLAWPAAALARPAGKAKMSSAGTTTVSGIIKGAMEGGKITVVAGKRSTTVDASHATIRNKGKFTSASALTGGSYVRAHGTMNGTTLDATSIEIVRPAPQERCRPSPDLSQMTGSVTGDLAARRDGRAASR
jgi:hypothetical protein